MKTRYIWTAFGLGFFVTLAVIVGQRLTSEAMAVMVGVIAGVAASIPTSLIVVWFAMRTTLPRHFEDAERRSEARRTSEPPPVERTEPRIVVMAQPVQPSPASYQNIARYPPAAYPAYAYPPQPALPPRRFTVIGGAEVSLDEPELPQEVTWQR